MGAQTPLLDRIGSPADLRQFPESDLAQIADELRAATIEAVSKTGGHLGAGLGVVELSVALHYVFHTPDDRIIWDVGHQAYPHKILTGRRDRIETLRQAHGLSGFTKRVESVYDPFGAAHSSTSISAAFGMAVAHGLKGEARRAIAVIGDGALSAGMAYEALNNAGAASHRPLVILNDNNMSIAPSLGAITNYLLDLVPRTDDHRMGEVKAMLAERYPGVLDCARRYAAKSTCTPSGTDTVFEKLGFEYIGPINGHDLDQLVPVLRQIRDAEAPGPVLLHIITEKGHGYGPAETSEDKYHGVSKFEVPTGALKKGQAKAPSYTAVYARALIQEAERDDSIVAITAAMPSGTGVDKFAQRFPARAFDVGIAEQHGVTFAAGLATEGMKPFVTIYSTFLQRAYDQIVHDVAIQGLPVRFAIDRAGLVGADGATHAGAFDVAYLGCLPGFVIMAAADEAELMDMVATAAAYDAGPIAFRYPRGEGIGAPLPERGRPLEIGRGRIVREGTSVALLSFGGRLKECLMAADELNVRGFSTTVADARFAKPIDEDLLRRLVREHETLILVEEASTGGFATQAFHVLARDGLLDDGVKVRAMGLPDRFIDQGAPEEMYTWAGLKAADIVTTALSALAADGNPRLTAARAVH